MFRGSLLNPVTDPAGWERELQTDYFCPLLQSLQMIFKEENRTIDAKAGFKETLSIQQGIIEDGDTVIATIDEPAVYIRYGFHT
jgi:hypothetical protein